MENDILDTKKVDEAKSYYTRFILWPSMWKTFDIELSPNKWQEYKFKKSIKKTIPDRKGVYSFVIKPNVAGHPSCSYLMYIGQTTDQTLRERFGQYVAEQKGKGKVRPKVAYILNKYKNHLFFVCMPIDDPLSPKTVESKLIKALLPPVNDTNTFPSEIKRIIKAAF